MADQSNSIVVLIVEDEALLRMLIVDVFRDEGFDVIEASDARSAVELLIDHAARISALVTDVQMALDCVAGSVGALDPEAFGHAGWNAIFYETLRSEACREACQGVDGSGVRSRTTVLASEPPPPLNVLYRDAGPVPSSHSVT